MKKVSSLMVLPALVAAGLVLLGAKAELAQAADCVAPANPVECENSLPGSPPEEWESAGSSSIQGFATDFSVDQGETVHFKVDTDASDYRIDIYRLGWYGGDGARLHATVEPSASLPQVQPACLYEDSTGLTDCGNWEESASWAVPQAAPSGIYIARLQREDETSGSNHIVFVVRDDDGNSDVLFQPSDSTWQAYNSYGGNNLYGGHAPAGRAYKVSYNRPFNTRETMNVNFLFSAEYPMIRWLERNGFDVSYFTDMDSARRGAELLDHRLVLSVGHDEYWSAGQRQSFENARAAGVNLAFFSANEVFWKTRWEPSIDGSGTPHRTLVSYKETHAGAKIDPNPAWTGTWRDPRFSPPADGGRPENALTGQIFTVNGYTNDAMSVPAEYGKLRLWRNTAAAELPAGGALTFAPGTLGYEWDEDLDNGHRPNGIAHFSSTTVNVHSRITDHGSNYAPGAATHRLTLYKHPSGALVFGAGTVQWSWGLDGEHDHWPGGSPPPPSRDMQQATVNLFADMGVQPATRQADLVAASASTDDEAPSSLLVSPVPFAEVQTGTPVTISGTATDAGDGRVANVEVSTDGGSTWHPATGRGNWTYRWTPGPIGHASILTRAIDDSANMEPALAGTTVDVVPRSCPCSLWNDSVVPATTSFNDPDAVELGLKFTPDVDGFVTAVRFYKGDGNTGTHVGSLWTVGGTKLAEATFTDETATGWQEIAFPGAVAVDAGDTYVVSYHAPNGHYAVERPFFTSEFVNMPLRAPSSAASGGNGVFRYGPGGFPSNSSSESNYFVDLVFASDAEDTTAPTIDRVEVGSRTGTTAVVSWRTNETATTRVDYGTSPGSLTESQTAPGFSLAHSVTLTGLTPGETYYYVVRSTDGSGNSADSAEKSFLSETSCPCTLWADSVTPGNPSEDDSKPVELGVKFAADVDGWISGIRFYKGPGNTGTHVGRLWTVGGTKLAEATFTDETGTGWQTVRFATAVEIDADTTYVASYHAPNGHFAFDRPYFGAAHLAPPLRAFADGAAGPNGVFSYGPGWFPATGGTLPGATPAATNYYVDVLFETSEPSDETAPVLTGLRSEDVGASTATIRWTTNEPATSLVEYGTSPTTLTSSASSTGVETEHAVALSDLSEGTTYWFRAVSEDAAGNRTASAVRGFTATATRWTETTDADFTDGALAGTEVVDGTVRLASDDFVDAFDQADGPAGQWEPIHASHNPAIATWSVVNGVYVHELNATPDAANYHPSLLSAALTPAGDFSISARQRIAAVGSGPGDVGVLGFVLGSPDPSRYFVLQYVMSVGGTKLGLRLKQLGPDFNETVAENMGVADPEVGRWYDLRLDVTGNTIKVYIDGALQLTHTMSGYAPGRLGLLGYEGSRNEYDDVVLVNSSHASSGTYTSNVFDAGAAADWGLPTWTAAVPSGTTLALSARWGDTPEPDATWTAFAPLSTEDPIDVRARYVQWRTELAGDGAGTPKLESITLPYTLVRNTPPSAQEDTFEVDEDGELSGNVAANDTDPDDDGLTVSTDGEPVHGTLNMEENGSFGYTPDANYNGPDSFTYKVSDGHGGEDTATVAVTVRSVNDVPVAADDSLETAEDTARPVAVLANDGDVDGDALAASVASEPGHGTVAVKADGSLEYTPALDYHGPDSFTYVARDGEEASAAATVAVTVTSVNDRPVARDDADTVAEDGSVVVDVLANDTDADGDTLSVSEVAAPAHGSTEITSAGVRYTPNPNYHGPDSFAYTVADGQGGTRSAEVTIDVRAANDQPVAADDTLETAEDTANTIDVLANDNDPDGDELTASVVGEPSHGTLTLKADGSFEYTPNANYNGPDAFTYKVSDGHGGEDTASVAVTVTEVNYPPVAEDDLFEIEEDGELTGDVVANDRDRDGDAFTVTVASEPSHGTLSLEENGSFEYTPDANYNGPDAFTYKVSDGQGGEDIATVAVTVTPVNDPPAAADDVLETAEGTPAAVDVLGNDTDAEGDELTIKGKTNGSHGTVECSDGSCTYTPEGDFHGSDSFTYTVSDGQGGEDSATVNITVGPENDSPVAEDDAFEVEEDGELTDDVLANDTDSDGDALVVSLGEEPAHGTLSLEENGSFEYTPDPNYNGPDSFTYKVSDGQGGEDIATVAVTVTPVNDAPAAANDVLETAEGAPAALDVLGNDTDVEGDELAITGGTGAAHGKVVCSDGSCTYTPEGDFHGSDSFTYTVSDGLGGEDSATVSITVRPMNDSPRCTAVQPSTARLWPPDHTFRRISLVGATDVDGDQLTFKISGVTQDENVKGVAGRGDKGPDARRVAGHPNWIELRAERNPNGNGRVYSISYTVSDGKGGQCSGVEKVAVPRDRGGSAFDSGGAHNSFKD